MQLKNKKVFITGGTGGIGKPLIKMLIDAGAEVTDYNRQTEGGLTENLDAVCEKVAKLCPDILINMAGYNSLSYCEDQNYEDILSLNLLVPMRLTQAVLPEMKKKGSGQVINIGSMTALIPLPHLTGYVAAKAGLKGFNDSLRRELANTDIDVTHIIPRAVKTDMNSGAKAQVNKKTGIHHDDPQKVAEIIFKAIIDRKKEVRIGWPERFFAFLNATAPAVIDMGLQKNRAIGEEVLDTYKLRMEKTYEEDTTNLRSIAN